jgi:hypothetical protein
MSKGVKGGAKKKLITLPFNQFFPLLKSMLKYGFIRERRVPLKVYIRSLWINR